MNTETKIAALAKHLDCAAEDIEVSKYDDNLFECGRQEYLVLTDDEADEAVLANVKDSLWAFNTDFLLSHCDLPRELEPAIKAFQSEECEGANDAILKLVEKCGNIDDLAREAVAADGRGHFLASYDGHEHEVRAEDDECLYVYRVN